MRALSLLLTLAALNTPTVAAADSLPSQLPLDETIPVARDVAYP